MGMGEPYRVQLSRRKGWRMPPDTVKVDRTTRWGNRVSEPQPYGDPEAHRVAVEEYRRWIFAPKQASFRGDVRRELHGKHLACWCKPHLACHADVLLLIANGEERGAALRPAP
jgi:hypothetical protein